MSDGKTLAQAADAAGMSEKTARKWREGAMPSDSTRERTWRTRKDPFEGVWEQDVIPLLERDEKRALETKGLFEGLQARYPGRFSDGQLRTLQRRVSDWRALHGPDQEVYFPQKHVPGREGAFDFTCCNELAITIRGVPFPHLLFHFILSFSKWQWVTLAFSETFEAMLRGLQESMWTLGGVPAIWRSDNLSAACHCLKKGASKTTPRYQGLLDHYKVGSTRITAGNAHENGVSEKSHDTLKKKLEHALVERGSRDFDQVDDYMAFVREVVDALNRRAEKLLQEERRHLASLPTSRLPEYTEYRAKVRDWSTVHFAKRTYSVPSRLKRKWVDIRQYPDHIEIRYDNTLTATIPRIHGQKTFRVDYRHVIWSLVRKPGAFARYRYQEDLFPTVTFREAYDSLVSRRGPRADVEYVRILHLAASTVEVDVENALRTLLDGREPFDFMAVKALTAPEPPEVPDVHIDPPNLDDYDGLLPPMEVAS